MGLRARWTAVATAGVLLLACPGPRPACRADEPNVAKAPSAAPSGAAEPAAASEAEAFRRAAASAKIAGYSLSKVHRWLREAALRKIDPATGLYRADGRWNYRDTAADCYPFLVWAAWATDAAALDGPVRKALHAEIRLCNHLDRIPVPYDFARKAKQDKQAFDAMVFGASEYLKDGLVAVVEVTGRDEWFERMRDIADDVWKHAKIDTPHGRIPSKNVEVNGEQIQVLARLFGVTRDRKYLQWAERLADYYLKPGDFVPTRLRDHGCEIIGGLGLLLGVESEVSPAKAREYLPLVRKMLEEINRRGLNPDGLMLNTLAASPGRREGRLSDGWGYNYVGYLCYDLAAGKSVYRPQVAATLANLRKPQYRNYPWEGRSIDGYADSIEGAIYLLNRVPVAAGLAWVDREMDANVVRSQEPLAEARLWGTHKLQSNGVRTTIMHALMHTRGLRALPWRQDLALGAHPCGEALAIVLKAGGEQPWSGKLLFDVPRHRLYLGFRRDWPRMNTLPEWFTVRPERTYTVGNVATTAEAKHTGRKLHEGLPLKLAGGEELRLLVR
jgi:hypothetical protein